MGRISRVPSTRANSYIVRLRAAIDASPGGRATLRTPTRQNLLALGVRTGAMKTAALKIASLVAMLERGETIVPHGTRPPRR